MSKHAMMLCLGAALAMGACGGGNDGEGESEGGENPAAPEAFAGMDTQLDLLELAHLADVHHHGLYIDLGTAAQAKYTGGDWRTGWGASGSEADATFAYAQQRARLYFNLDEGGEHKIRFRLKSFGTRRLTVFVNGETGPNVTVSPDAFNEYTATLPANMLHAGENNIMFLFGGSAQVGGETVSAAFESVRIIRGDFPEGEFSPPSFDALVSSVELGGAERMAAVTRRPMSLHYHVQVPRDGRLGFGVGFEGQGEAPVKVAITNETGTRREVFSANASGSWNDQTVDLSSYAGQVVRVEFISEGAGAGRIAWSVPRILVPHRERREFEPARNVVVVLIDTLRADKLRPFNPRSRVEAPAIDGIARDGATFTLAQSPENWTKPSVASVLTGLTPITHQQKTESASLGPDATLLSEHLKEQGFRTGSFIANGYVSDRFGFDQGWDHYTNYIREQKNTEAENVFTEAAQWIEQNRGERFFAYVQTIDPHVPYDPPEADLRRYDARTDYTGPVRPRQTHNLLVQAKRGEITFTRSDRRRLEGLHDGEITQHDRHFARFLQRLEQLELADDTLVVVVSDHGEEFADHGKYGHGHTVFQELLHVPLMFRLPGRIQGGQSIPEAVSTLNIPATVTEFLGVPTMETQEGHSLAGYMLGAPPAGPTVAFSDFQDERRVITTGRWKFIMRGNLRTTMYDLQQDPGEQRSLDASANPIARRFCRVMLGQFLGASDRGNWISAEQGAGTQLRQRAADIDEEMRGQLEALGYAH